MKKTVLAIILGFLLLPPAWAFSHTREYEKRIFAKYEEAAKQGDANAQYELGSMYFSSQGGSLNYAEAEKWYRLSANQGNPQAQLRLGHLYLNGTGVLQDYKEAAKWFRLAAEHDGHDGRSGKHFIGAMYHEGTGVPRDYKEALKWYRISADQGHTSAQMALGTMYAGGQGVPHDDVLAYALFNVVASHGVPAAITKRDRAIKKLSLDQIEGAQKLSQELSQPNNFLKTLDAYVVANEQ